MAGWDGIPLIYLGWGLVVDGIGVRISSLINFEDLFGSELEINNVVILVVIGKLW